MTDLKKLAEKIAEQEAKKDAAWGGCCVALVLFFAWPLLALWRGYVLQILWTWFLKPAGFAVPSIYLLVGAVLTLSLALPYRIHDGDNTTQMERLVASLVVPLAALFFGWVWVWLGWGM